MTSGGGEEGEGDLALRIATLEEELHRLRQAARARDLAAGPPPVQDEQLELVVTVVAGREHAFDDVEQALRLPALAPLPGAPDGVVGVMTLWGEQVPVISAHRRLGLPLAPLDLLTPLVVCRHAGARFAVLVERVVGLLEVPRAHLVPPPPGFPCASFLLGLLPRPEAEDLPVFSSRAFFSLAARRACAIAPGEEASR